METTDSVESRSAMESGTTTLHEVKCINCGAKLTPAANICWLCYAPAPKVVSSHGVRHLGTEAKEFATGGFSLASLMMFVTLVAVTLGVTAQWRGLGIPLGVFWLAVWIRTVRRIRERETHGTEVTALDKFLMFLSSLAGTLVIFVLIAVAGVAALFVACLTLIRMS